ncbi:MAG: hypothetical protein K2N23_00385, partial [Clostridia bacterium]|nr:hypothetical protein [Clostridia bacterium]
LEQYIFLFNNDVFYRTDETFDAALKIEILNFCIEETGFAADVLLEEDYSKCLEVFRRKQYESKLLKSLLGTFLCFLYRQEHNSAGKKLLSYLERDVNKRIKELQEQKAEKTFMPLKKQIEKIASGVKGYCFLVAESPRDYGVQTKLNSNIKSELNSYIKEKYSYDFNSLNERYYLKSLILIGDRKEDINHILQKVLYDDNEFWGEHKNFNVLTFIEAVYCINDSRHAEKIIDYIFNEISKSQYGKQIIDNSLPLIFLKKEEFLSGLEERTFRFTFDRFKNYFNLHTLSKDNLCYPFASVNNADDKAFQGKQLVEEFLREIYPDEYDRILKILTDEVSLPSAAFSAKNKTLRDVKVKDTLLGGNNKVILTVSDENEWNIQHILDFPTFGYHRNIVDREAVAVYCPEYFSPQNIWNRFYLKAYSMLKLVKDKKACFANLFEVYYDLFQFIEKKTGIRTSYQRNTEGRNEAYLKLKSILKQYGVNISDKYKSDYIISLLDRKVAIREESERFPVLEQLGDAVYGFALAEMIFYDPDIEHAEAVHHDFISADIQIGIANKIGISKLYLSSYSLPRKYETDLLIDADQESYAYEQEREQFENNQKYIADSLEMIIGTICRDCGYQTAIDFTKQILRKSYPNKFSKELRWSNKQNSNIDRDYWTRILPAPYSHFEPPHKMFWDAFDKFFKAYVLGTEDVALRQYITNSFGDNELYDDIGTSYEVNQVFYEYLHKGLESVIEKFSNSVKEKYKKLKK